MHYLHDFRSGDTIELGSLNIAADPALEFCRRFDPQRPFLDTAVRDPLYGGPVVSGWQLVVEVQSRLVRELMNQTAHHGVAGVSDIEFGPPVTAGTPLTAEFTVMGTADDREHADRGDLFGRVEVTDDSGRTALSMLYRLSIGKKPPASL
ncbi:MAG: hypothetical protein AAFX58_00210 [Pseudomonadota bacterium]